MSNGFTLNLGFGGMCLMVPDFEDGKLVAMHVLFPHSGCCDYEHVPMFVFDENAPSGKPPTNKPAPPDWIPGRTLDLSGLSSGPPLEMLTSGIAKLDACSKVPRKFLADDYSGNDIVGRVTFRTGTVKIDPCGRGGCWDYEGDIDVELGIRFVWTMHIPENELVLRLPKIGNPSDVKELRLRPDPNVEKNVLNLWIFHSPVFTIFHILPPQTSLNDPPKPGEKAKHFKPYLTLVTCSHDPTPIFKQLPDTSTNPHCYSDIHQGLDLFCIGAQAVAEPK